MTRARLFVLIDAFERDIRAVVTRFVLSEMSDEEALRGYFEAAADRQAHDATASSDIVDYLYLREGYDLLNTHRGLLPEELAGEVRQLTENLDRLVGIRQRVMHARPLLAGDSDAAVSLLNMYRSRYWPELKRMISQLHEDPSWEPVVTITADPGYALHNLPLPDYDETGLVGRAKETEELVKLIKRRRESVLTITGEGGIGKTALALDVAYRIVDDPDQLFDAVLWTSLKFEKLTASGIRAIAGTARDILGAAQPIGRALDTDFSGSLQELAAALEGLEVLIVVDNLETVGGAEFSILYDELPDSVNYLVTSRIGVGEYERRYPLQPLRREDSLKLFNDFVRARRIAGLDKLSGEARIQVVTSLRHSPLGIKWFALAVEAGNDPLQLIHHQDELLEFCVRSVYDSLEPAAREVLRALYIFGRAVTVDELVLLLEKTTDHVNVAIQELLRGSLIRRENGAPGELTLSTSITETAREFMSRRVKPDTEFERLLSRRESEYRTTEERRAVDMANRSLAPVVVRTRSQADVPAAQILRRALTQSSAKDFKAALEQVEIARRLKPDFWEVDRVEGFLRSQNGDLAEATACYKRAYSNASDTDRGFVAHFFAGHLARRVRDVGQAFAYAKEAHEKLQLPDTAVALGNYLVWTHSFTEGIALIEPVSVSQQGKMRLIAITSIAEAYKRWCDYTINQERNPLLAHARARQGADIALAALQSGVSDPRLVDSAADCCALAIRAAGECLRSSTSVPGLASWLDAILSAVVRFINSFRWRTLSTEIERLARTPSCPAAGRRLAVAVRELDAQAFSSRVDDGAIPKEGLIGEIVSIRERYGFVRHPAYPNNVYFKHDAVIGDGGFAALRTGALVRFSVAQSERGPRAEDVSLV